MIKRFNNSGPVVITPLLKAQSIVPLVTPIILTNPFIFKCDSEDDSDEDDDMPGLVE